MVSCWWHVWEFILGLFCTATPTLTWCEEYKSRNIKRGKVVSVHTMKAYVACTGTAPVTLYLITMWRSTASLIPLQLYPWGKKLEAMWGGSQTSRRKWPLPATGIQTPRIIQPVAYSLYWTCYSNSSNEEMGVSKLTPYRTCRVCWRQWFALCIGQIAVKPFSWTFLQVIYIYAWDFNQNWKWIMGWTISVFAALFVIFVFCELWDILDITFNKLQL